MKKFSFPKELIQLAKIHGSKREAINQEVRQTRIEFQNENASFCDFIGVLGELIAAFEMLKKGKAFFMNDLFSEDKSQTPGADIIVQNYKIDVKATTKNAFHIPAYKVEKSKSVGISHYWIVKINLEEYLYQSFFYPVEAVSEWETVEYFGYEAYKKQL